MLRPERYTEIVHVKVTQSLKELLKEELDNSRVILPHQSHGESTVVRSLLIEALAARTAARG